MSDDDIARALAARNRAGDLEAIPVEQEDTRPFLQRLKDALASGGWQDPQPGQRGTFVPGQVGQDGKVSPAVPGIIQQPAEGLQSLMTAPLSDIVRSGDRDAIRAASEASFDVASILPAAGVVAGRTIPEGAAGIFGGRLAKTADQAALKRAEDMAAKGAPREQIWQDTGWFKGVDGKWRFEIDDSRSRVAPDFNVGDIAPLPEAVLHPELYRAYDLSRVTAEKTASANSALSGDQMTIGGGRDSSASRSAGLHEIQHAVQGIEDFAKGGNPIAEGRLEANLDPTVNSRQSVFDGIKEAHEEARAAYSAALDEKLPWFGSEKVKARRKELANRVARLAELRAEAHKNLMDALKTAPTYDAVKGWGRYERLAGEVESRAVESRRDLTPDQRRVRPPWLDYDVPENQQIVRLASNPNDPTTAAILALLTQQQGAQPQQ